MTYSAAKRYQKIMEGLMKLFGLSVVSMLITVIVECLIGPNIIFMWIMVTNCITMLSSLVVYRIFELLKRD